MSDEQQQATPADLKALERLPEGVWFFVDQVHFMVINPRWRCDRLKARGFLESEVVESKSGALVTRFRRLPNKNTK